MRTEDFWSSVLISPSSVVCLPRQHDEISALAGLRTKPWIGDDQGGAGCHQLGDAVDRLLRNGHPVERLRCVGARERHHRLWSGALRLFSALLRSWELDGGNETTFQRKV